MNVKLKPERLFRYASLLMIAVFLLGSLNHPIQVAAQTVEDAWSQPINLSHSGGTSNPILVMDPNRKFHVIWNDAFAGFRYTSGDGLEWSDPAAIEPPFETSMPKLVADPVGGIHALWLDPKGVLYASRVAYDNFADPAYWSPPYQLSTSAAGVAGAADDSGQLHVVFARAVEEPGSPPGIYYARWNREEGWTKPVLLYQSPYFRSLNPDTTHIQLTTANVNGVQRVYIAWDNPQRERVYLVRSLDGGENWDQVREVDRPIDGTVTGGPANIQVGAAGENILVIWQSDFNGATCNQYYQWSFDGGSTWQDRQRLLEDLPGCSQDNQILPDGNGYVYLLTTIHKQVYLLAWNGAEWSNPRVQLTLTGFVDPDTFKQVDFGCQDAVLVGGDQLYVVGCDGGGGGDIWITSRLLEDPSSWFSSESVWVNAVSVNKPQTGILSPVLVPDGSGRLHAFWSQPDGGPSSGAGTAIYYSRWEQDSWSMPKVIVTAPVGVARNPDAVIDAHGQVYLVWSGGEQGEIYFTRNNADQASLPSSWSEPKLLPAPRQAGSSPAILVDGSGVLYVAYAIPLNEKRGIYVTRSDDGGDSWSKPVLVFDATSAGWAMVDHPKLSWTENGHLHLIWTRYSVPDGTGSLGLYYARSGDGGKKWSQAEMVMDKPVLWSALVGVGNQTVHRLWQEWSSGRTTLWHEQSLDSGVTWERVAPVSIFGETVGKPVLASDGGGGLHLLQLVNRGPNAYSLQHWSWDGSTWSSEQNMDVSDLAEDGLGDIGAGISSNGDLGVVLVGSVVDPTTGEKEAKLYFVHRKVDLLSGELILPASNSPTTARNTPTPPPEATAETTPTPAIQMELLQQGGGNGPGEPTWLGFIAGPLAAGVLVLFAFVFGLRKLGAGRTRS